MRGKTFWACIKIGTIFYQIGKQLWRGKVRFQFATLHKPPNLHLKCVEEKIALIFNFRYNIKTRQVEIRSPTASGTQSKAEPSTDEAATLQKAADFVRAFICGFEVDDALALLRLDDLFLDSFQV